jgi:hypothetical protein
VVIRMETATCTSRTSDTASQAPTSSARGTQNNTVRPASVAANVLGSIGADSSVLWRHAATKSRCSREAAVTGGAGDGGSTLVRSTAFSASYKPANTALRADVAVSAKLVSLRVISTGGKRLLVGGGVAAAAEVEGNG